MPFGSISDLPVPVRKVLPKHAQDIYKEAFNNAYAEYKDPNERRGDEDREAVAHKVAWSAVKRKYQKTTDGSWQPKK